VRAGREAMSPAYPPFFDGTHTKKRPTDANRQHTRHENGALPTQEVATAVIRWERALAVADASATTSRRAAHAARDRRHRTPTGRKEEPARPARAARVQFRPALAKCLRGHANQFRARRHRHRHARFARPVRHARRARRVLRHWLRPGRRRPRGRGGVAEHRRRHRV